MTSAARPPARLHTDDAALVAPWFAFSGCDTSSPQWAAAWAALVAADLANDRNLRLYPTAEEATDDNYRPEDSLAAQTVRVALTAGAHCAKTHHPADNTSDASSDAAPVHTRWGSEVDVGSGVAIVLALFHTCPAVLADTLATPPPRRDQHVLAELDARVLGIYDHATAALSAQINAARTAPDGTRPKARALGPTWHPLVEIVLHEAVHDVVFAEHILTRLAASDAGIGYVVLPDGRWMLMHTTQRD